MNRQAALVLSVGGFALSLFVTAAVAQPSDPPPAAPARGGGARQGGGQSVVDRLLALDKNGDGKLTKDEVTDPRLERLFNRADKDGDGTVTKEELNALAATMQAEGPGPGGDRGPGGPGGGPGRGGPRGPGGFGGPPQPGVVLPPMLQDRLNLTPEQREKIQALQADVDRRLASILTDEQKQQIQEMRNRGPGRGPGGPDGSGGGNGPGPRGRGPGGPPNGQDAPPPPPER